MNKKGQALVEFILILPVILIVLMSLIDIGNIFVKKNELNNDIEVVRDLYIKDKDKMNLYLTKENLIFEEKKDGNIVTINIEKKITINAPILSNIIGRKYSIKSSKSFYEEPHEQ